MIDDSNYVETDLELEQGPSSNSDAVGQHRTAREALFGLSSGELSANDQKEDAKSTHAKLYMSIAALRSAAIETKSIFTFCFVCSHNNVWSNVYGFVMLFVALFVQTVIPIAIVATEQPLDRIEIEPRGCPNRGDGLTKTIGFVLSIYFVVVVVSLCTNKLFGLGFLKNFVNLGWKREMVVNLAILSQLVGMVGAGGAQFLLFIGNGGESYIILLLQSMAMTFCLTVDQNLVPDKIGKWTSGRISKVTKDELICDVGISEGNVPEEIAAKLRFLESSEKLVLLFIGLFGFGWCCALAYCI